jgi:hypothetical protein
MGPRSAVRWGGAPPGWAGCRIAAQVPVMGAGAAPVAGAVALIGAAGAAAKMGLKRLAGAMRAGGKVMQEGDAMEEGRGPAAADGGAAMGAAVAAAAAAVAAAAAAAAVAGLLANGLTPAARPRAACGGGRRQGTMQILTAVGLQRLLTAPCLQETWPGRGTQPGGRILAEGRQWPLRLLLLFLRPRWVRRRGRMWRRWPNGGRGPCTWGRLR